MLLRTHLKTITVWFGVDGDVVGDALVMVGGDEFEILYQDW